MRRRLSWLRLGLLPLAIGASVLLSSWFYLMWNTTAGELLPSLRFRTKATIAGIVKETAPVLSLNSVLTGAYQQWISRSVGQLSPMFKPAIAWKSQVYYKLLGMAPTVQILVGKQNQLMEIHYLQEYCSRNVEKLRPRDEEWATRIRGMQDFFEARGKVFVYIITPSKVAEDPRIIPEGYICPASAKDRTDKLRVYDEILARHGVRFVDAASGLVAAREEYGVDMFPRGGIHWNSLASALGTEKVIAAVNAQRREPLLATLGFAWHISYNPQGSDRDLLDLLNMKDPDAHYPVPELAYRSTSPANGCHSITIAEVGGSFLGGLNSTLQKLACPPRIDNWFYWDTRRMQFADGRLYELPMNADARRKSLLDADVIFLEENEEVEPASKHGEQMVQEVARLADARQ